MRERQTTQATDGDPYHNTRGIVESHSAPA